MGLQTALFTCVVQAVSSRTPLRNEPTSLDALMACVSFADELHCAFGFLTDSTAWRYTGHDCCQVVLTPQRQTDQTSPRSGVEKANCMYRAGVSSRTPLYIVPAC